MYPRLPCSARRFPAALHGNPPEAAQALNKAEKYSKQAIEITPTLPKPAEMTDEQFEKAKNQSLAMAHSGLGLVFVRRGKYAEAIPELEQAVKIDPIPDPVNYYLLGLANKSASHFDDAVAAFNQLRGHAGPNAGDVQERRGRGEEARVDAIERAEVSTGLRRAGFMQENTRNRDAALEERLGYKFSSRALLERALTHSSAVPELKASGAEEASRATLPKDNERLEFLGDAVLGLLATEYLLANFPEWSEGQLSKGRARIVNAGSLEAAARRLRLGEHLRLGRGEEKTGGREKQTLLADAFEAVVAGIYLDAGLGPAREVLRRVLFEQAWKSAASASRIRIANRRCRNFCRDAGVRLRSIA